MKRTLLALVLALVMAAGLVPMAARAAAPQALPVPVPVIAALPGSPAMPQEKTYSIEMTCSGPGTAELYADAAGARESVYFLADPEPGYQVSFAKCGYYMEQYEMELYYVGDNVYEMVMPDGDVMLDLEFVQIPGDRHDVILTVTGEGTAAVDQSAAKAGESLFVEVAADPGWSVKSVRARSGGEWIEGYYLGKTDSQSVRYEIFMPDAELEILVDFSRNGPYTIDTYVDGNGTIELSHTAACELEEITVTAVPDRGHRVVSVSCLRSPVTQEAENVWSFIMPRYREEVHAVFEPIVYPVSVTTELPMGGTAYPDAEGATIGQTVTVVCVPDEGYRVARITGPEDLTDNGDNTYSFVMEDAAVELSVLFLRENNPFLDINETQFYHDSVLWAVENGITNGLDATHFGPLETCSRSQVVTFLWRSAGSPEPVSDSNPFRDVAPGDYYYKPVLWAVENGITNGLTADTFGPNENCNRSQVVTFLWRSFGEPTPDRTENPFTDVQSGNFYETAVLWALENNITTGIDETHFDPNGKCLRSQVVTFLYRADQIPEPEPEPLPFPDPIK